MEVINTSQLTSMDYLFEMIVIPLIETVTSNKNY